MIKAKGEDVDIQKLVKKWVLQIGCFIV
jgi:hypothetical protein